MVDFSQVTGILLGSSVVEQIANSQGVVLWKKTGDEPETDSYFYVEDISGSDITLSIKKSYSSAPTITVFKSTDSTNWESMGSTSTTAITATIPANSKLYLKANINSWYYGSYINYITASGNHNVGGNIMSLLYGDNFQGQTTFPSGSKYNFQYLFSGDLKLVSASKLTLPATALTEHCYECMFQNCTSLTTAPALPATTLTSSCYNSMFKGCSSLTTAPALPATTLDIGSYYNMFYGCNNLRKVTVYAVDISAIDCLYNWLYGVSSTGDFYNLGGASYRSGASGIPSGWTEHTSL